MRTRYLRDAHLHLGEYGASLGELDVSGHTTLAGCLEALAGHAEGREPGAWVVARGLRSEGLAERRAPTARELDEACGGRAVVVRSFDLHALSVSTRVLERAGIGYGTPDPRGGVIERDRDGRASGRLLEAACRAVWSAMPSPGSTAIREHIVAAQRDLLARGVVEVHEMHARPEMVRELLALDDAGGLELRVHCYATGEHIGAVEAAFERACAGGRRSRSGRVSLDGLKLFTDGTLNSRTAWMLAPYADPLPEHPRGTAMMTADETRTEMGWAFARGYQVAAHAIGDASVRGVLDAYESLGAPAGAGGEPAVRVEHAQFIERSDVGRFARLNVVASMQPCHLLTDMEAIVRLVPDRAGRAFALRELIDAARARGHEPSELVWLGSDAPVVPPCPEDNRQASVERRRGGMEASSAIGIEQAISAAEWELLQSCSGAD